MFTNISVVEWNAVALDVGVNDAPISRCCLFNNHQAKDYIDSFVTHCSRVWRLTEYTLWTYDMFSSVIV